MTAATNPRVRLSPAERREQLLQLGLDLFAGGSVEDISIDRLSEEGGVSRGLLYHYFGSKQGFHEAVVRRAAQDLVDQTAPPPGGDPVLRLRASMTAYVDYVVANHAGYLSLVRAAAGGNEALRQIYEEAYAELTDRIFREDAQGELIQDSALLRLVVRGWASMSEHLVLAWCDRPDGVTRDQLIDLITESLPAIVTTAITPSE